MIQSAGTRFVWLIVFVPACSGGAVGDGDGGADISDGQADRGDAYRPRDDSGGIEDVLPEIATFPPTCGDGTVGPAEECDDGNRENGDGCDWLCHSGAGSFEYPPPDPTVPPVTLSGGPVTVVAESEVMHGDWAVAWGPDAYGVAYDVDRPAMATRFRLVDHAGRTIAGPIDLPAVDGGRVSALTADFGGFRLLRSVERGAFLTIIGPDGDLVGDTTEFRRFPYGVEDSAVLGAAQGADRMYLRWIVNDVEWTPYWLFEARGLAGESLGLEAVLSGDVDLNPPSSARPVVLPGGVATVIGFRVVIFDTAMNLVGWSGVIPAMPSRGGPDALVATDEGMLALWLHLPEGGTTLDLWAAGFDTTGGLILPPHVVREGWLDYLCQPTVAASSSSTAVVVAAVEGSDGYCSDSRLKFLGTDRWGNPRSESVGVPFEGTVRDAPGWFTVVADDEGWSVWAVTQDPREHQNRIVFQRVVADVP